MYNMKVLKNMQTNSKDLLIIRSFYNNKLTDSVIEKYKDNILFTYIDYYNMNRIIKKNNIRKYYSFFDIIGNIKEYNLIDYYDDSNVNSDIIIYNKKGTGLIYIREHFLLSWNIYEENRDSKFLVSKNVPLYNIPIEFL